MKKKEENYYDVPTDFEPSIATKKYWRKTRKVEREYGKQTWFPGLFNTVDYNTDIAMFFGILFLEILGLYFLGTAVRWNSLIFYGFAIAMLLDFVCVFWAHAFSGTILENKNRRIIAKYEKEVAEDTRLKWKNVFLKLITVYPAEAFLLFIAIGKIYFYMDAKGGYDQILDPETGRYDLKIIGVCVIYILIFVLHTMFTGYAIHGYRFKQKILKEYQIFTTASRSHIVNNLADTIRYSDNQINAYREYLIPASILKLHNVANLRELQEKTQAHYLKENGGGSFKLYTWGLLKDDDLHSMAQMHQDNDIEKLFLGIQGLKHQLACMVSDPKFT